MFKSFRNFVGGKPIKREGTRRAADGIEPDAIVDLTEDPVIKQLVDRNMDPCICPVCLDVVKEPVGTKCGHVFCKECLTRAMGPSKLCPKCRKTETSFVRLYTYLP